MAEIAVVGGICADMIAEPFAEIVGRDSNPSRILVRAGGVGFNFASRLAGLGHRPRLVCALGNDCFASLLASQAEEAGVLLDPVFAERSGVYLCINDADGDMRFAFSDLEGTEKHITPDALGPKLDMLCGCAACVLDGNLTAEAAEYLARNVTAPLFADPVSTKKAKRLLPILKRLYAIKPNIYEARALTGLDSPAECAAALVDMGCGAAFVSCGENGIYFADARTSGHAPAVPVSGVTTGAGDAAGAMLLHCLLCGASSAEAAKEANRFAAERILGQRIK